MNSKHCKLFDAIGENDLDSVKAFAEAPKVVEKMHAIAWASHKGNKEIVEFLLSKGFECSNSTALENASEKGYLGVVELLLSDGIEHPSNSYYDALNKACKNSHTAVVQLLSGSPRIEAGVTSTEIYSLIQEEKSLEIKKMLIAFLHKKLVQSQPLLAHGLFSSSLGSDEANSSYLLNSDVMREITMAYLTQPDVEQNPMAP
ncbi:Ankyrin repeats (3 copies) [Legionella massiliensis]|uniref:Ankyrin repeats (3 copies) n=1 Tax=Legionella massiliensis TaxID=1034943 RepID=A0A078L038_9GAMM|nr:ankyrin repeat domain-containing protein [Legionella massiliensis]CDZ78486.1 Ankyrin repeats (3 copies) [Legionella massiliensis]CEE14224.1 Ankyrin repeats (3 copies) [Legionella massiliensis]